MSLKGQVQRGEKWFTLYRDANGVLLPCISNDKDKMIDVELYLSNSKIVAPEPVTKPKKEK